MTKFVELGLSKQSAIALEKIGFMEPTEIQGKAIPITLSGRDVMASAQTGSGKTAAFALPVIQCLEQPGSKPRALVLVPTREFALQVEGQFERFAQGSRLRTVTLYGGTGYGRQMKALSRGVDIIVATPGRLFDFLERHCLDLSKVEIVILDEADRLMDMGFMPQVRKVFKHLPKDRQTLMFSATIDQRIERLAAEFLDNPVAVRANGQHIEPAEINQRIHYINEFGKDALLLQLIKEQNMSSVLVFTNTKRKAIWVKSRLRDSNVMAEDIHSNLSQSQRERTLKGYRDGAFPVLVATDVAARGLDVPTISHVINYDLPDSAQSYIHRIGRTGRAGRAGVAISFVSEDQHYLIRDIEKAIGRVLDPNAPKPRVTTKAVRRFRPRSRAKRRLV